MNGVSVAGQGTCFFLPESCVAIDVAQGLPFSFRAKNFLITHAHMDHASGIPYVVSQKALIKAPQPTFYMPPEMLDSMKNIIYEWQKIDGHEYEFNFKSVETGKTYELDKIHTFKPFKTFHRVPSVGYTVCETRKKLKKEFEVATQGEIVRLKRSGMELTEDIEIPLFSYTGDTTMKFWDQNPEVLKSKILFMEVTYWDKKKSVETAQEWGHIHLDEVIDRIADFKGEKLVFTHISSRYSIEYVRKLLQERVPKKYHDIVDVFPSI